MLVFNKIEELIKDKNIPIKDMANKMGITSQGLYQLLKKKDIKLSQLQKIADVLEVDICEFFGGSGKNEFEEELKYFIDSYDPPKYVKKIDPVGDILLQENRFLSDSLYNIYDQFVIHKPIENINIKYKIDIHIIKIYIHADGFNISFYQDGEYYDKKINGSPLLSKILINVYDDISDEDIKLASNDIKNSINRFNSFISQSKLIGWYRKNYKSGEEEIREILMRISRDFSIILDK
ncbi:helix-turn-helix domain-containing protein [Lentimicrobium sp. S6]|uniref:helix-turn-helix domain-containing protein n=1 Tax=Lentimicrobium sp. S6 TaxID=2735872 RepID=UPI0015535261|nr:helix-turn-helix transcriptional regulator [Lentimicrobium sp. S6]NPD48021.1 helix-turn-helix transcriptional regulator [Lentimicrobium sp. S6]